MTGPRSVFRLLVAVLLAAALAACGFALRGTTELPFPSINVNLSPNSQFGAQLRRQIRAAAPTVRIEEDPAAAAARLQIIGQSRERTEVALNAQGRVQEYELTLRITFQVLDALGTAVVPPSTLSATRTLPYDDNVAQAKESEAEALFLSMQDDLVQRILRRLDSADTRAAWEAAAEEREAMPPRLTQ